MLKRKYFSTEKIKSLDNCGFARLTLQVSTVLCLLPVLQNGITDVRHP
jgi:hypothetical protein